MDNPDTACYCGVYSAMVSFCANIKFHTSTLANSLYKDSSKLKRFLLDIKLL